MKEIKLKSLSLVNFKGVRSLEILFNTSGSTIISGRNGTGKSTVKDAFLWLLFGKNSNGDTDFGIKTQDENGVTIPNIPHEVSGIISVNGNDIKLRKSLVEKWSKDSFGDMSVFKGNVNEYYINDVPKKKSEYDAYIDDICSETMFRTITSVDYLVKLPKDKLRSFLFDMVGDFSDYEIAGSDEGLNELLDMLSGKTMEELRKQVSAEKSAIKKELADIPARIDELERTKPEEKDWVSIEKSISERKERLSFVNAKIEENKAYFSKSNEIIRSKENELSDARKSLLKAKGEAASKAEYEYRLIADEQRKAKVRAEEVKKLISDRELFISRNNEMILQREQRIDELNAKLSSMREKWHEINDSKFKMDEELICPTCKQKIVGEFAKDKIAELEDHFNENKAFKLNENKVEALSIKQKIEHLSIELKNANSDKQKFTDEIAFYSEELKNIQNSDAYCKVIESPDVDAIVSIDDEVINASELVSKLENELSELYYSRSKEQPSNNLSEEREEILSEIERLNELLYDKQQIERVESRKSELVSRQRSLSQELANKEKVESYIDRFNKNKVTMTEERINSKFSMIKWKMYNQLINGGEEQTCIPLINGVDYKDANTASKINAGIDIINAVSTHYGVFAPIFVDNAECVNELMKSESQLIRMVVTTEAKLTVSYDE